MTETCQINAGQLDGSVELTARTAPDGDRFIAFIDGLDLEGRGATADAAQQSLVQNMRAWLERQDTSGKLGAALGIDDLDEETEIVLSFLGDWAEHRSDVG